MTYYSILNNNKNLIYLKRINKEFDKYIKYKKRKKYKKFKTNILKNIPLNIISKNIKN